MDAERLRADLEALRGDLPQLRELVRDRAEAALNAEVDGLPEAEALELWRRHDAAVCLLRRQREDIAVLEAELAEVEPVEDSVEVALAVVRRERRRFLVEADAAEDALLAGLMSRRLEGVSRHAD